MDEFSDLDSLDLDHLNLDDIIDFGSTKKDEDEDRSQTSKYLYTKNGKPVEYTKETMEYYRVMRKRRTDPILGQEDIPTSIGFEFADQWDPYTGERLGPDPYGPLVFHPMTLAKHFYMRRLVKLWIQEQTEDDGHWGGTYDDGLGAGENIHIPGRGDYPELYLFRLPVQDIYLTKDHNRQIPIVGPKLTDEEVTDLNTKLQLVKDEYRRTFRTNPPNLVAMKKYYDMAISSTPDIGMSPFEIKRTSVDVIKQKYFSVNAEAVNELRKMSG
jgi:hypothetical protein